MNMDNFKEKSHPVPEMKINYILNILVYIISYLNVFSTKPTSKIIFGTAIIFY